MKGKFKVTPWKVEGRVDYNKLIKEFGTKPITKDLIKRFEKYGPLHLMLRRGFFFSHRDLDLVFKDYESGKGFFLYNGRGPSGEMHIGHLVPFLFTKWLQDTFKVNYYVEITDDEKFLLGKKSWEEIDKFAEDDILNIAAVGFDPDRTFIFRDTEYIKNAYKMILNVARKTTFSTAKAVFGFNNQTNIGMIFYPAYQTIPTFFERKISLIPAAIDQDPYWRIQRDVAESLGFKKTSAIHSKFLPPLTGMEGKMSASIKETAIYLSDDPETVRNKIMKFAFSGGQPTIEEHRRLGGNPDVDVAYQWLYMIFEEDDKRIKEIHDSYVSGDLLTGELKNILIEKLNKFLKDHRRRKKRAEKLVKKFKYDGKLAKKMWEKAF
jgi:tryptophanyl-tRNA synthetase